MNFSGKFGSASTIWYPASGYYYSGGSLGYVGRYGDYWSASPNGDNSYYACSLEFSFSGNVYPAFDSPRASAYSVRCLQE